MNFSLRNYVLRSDYWEILNTQLYLTELYWWCYLMSVSSNSDSWSTNLNCPGVCTVFLSFY